MLIQFKVPAPELIALEAVRLREDPVGPVAARAPAERAHAVAVHDAFVDSVIHSRVMMSS